MERILQEEAADFGELALLLGELEEAEKMEQLEDRGRFREGGRIDLMQCGDLFWLKQFRYVTDLLFFKYFTQ